MTTPVVLVSPSPVHALPEVSRALGAEVFVKREDQTHAELGGGKARKLVPLLAEAAERRATHLLTIGAIGSNHVFATAHHGRQQGLGVWAALVPHLQSEAARHVAGQTCALEVELVPARHEPHAVWQAGVQFQRLKAQGARPFVIPPGGTSPRAVSGCAAAGRELLQQIDSGLIPRPDAIFCVLGSGGTAAGLWQALSERDWPIVLYAVRVYPSWLLGRAALALLSAGLSPRPRPAALKLVDDQLGGGYGTPTDAGRAAQALFRHDGLELDLTYTAKAAAALIESARGALAGRRLLFWHTAPGGRLSSSRDALPMPEPLERLWLHGG
ncbi:MAG: pyridoxal-phosphate dependent enzyme [Myxococcales bacterium]|nr:pyridoxal-phosphate dependent enzyme [Myxococcales bacterium]